MIAMISIQKMIAKALHQSADFNDYCLSIIGKTFDFHIDPSIAQETETLPYVAIHKFNKAHDVERDDEWIVQLIMAIQSESEPIEEDGIKIFPSSSNVELMVDKAIEIIKEELIVVGVENSRLIRVSSFNVLITEVGEADDVQAIVTIKLNTPTLI